jgi:Carbohydrate-selective porin, OprB family
MGAKFMLQLLQCVGVIPVEYQIANQFDLVCLVGRRQGYGHGLAIAACAISINFFGSGRVSAAESAAVHPDLHREQATRLAPERLAQVVGALTGQEQSQRLVQPQSSPVVPTQPVQIKPVQVGPVQVEPIPIEPAPLQPVPIKLGWAGQTQVAASLQANQIAQTVQTAQAAPNPAENVRRQGSDILGTPSIQLQGVYRLEGSDSSARARVTATYPVTPHSMFGAVVDLTSGQAFSDSPSTGLDLSELYFTTSPAGLPELRFVGGLMDLTAYFDRNSFAKDGASHFFNLAFQTNPALSAAGLSSRIGLLGNWNLTDNIELKATTFSADRNLGSFAFDSFAGELGLRFGTGIIRGTYISSKDAGRRTGFAEIFQFPREDGQFGLNSGDREQAYGVNAELFIPPLNLGLFARYGRYDNITLGQGGNTYSFGLTLLDLWQRGDRLGIGYGRQLSDNDLRQAENTKTPDVLEVYYDMRVTNWLRAAVTFQERNEFSDTIFGFRLKTEFDVSPKRRVAR